MPKLIINLPCKVSVLESKIRSFCETNGCHDKAVVKAVVVNDMNSWAPIYRLGVFCLEKKESFDEE